jgi:hypothetical protein
MQPVLRRLRPVRHGTEVNLQRAALGTDGRAVAAALDDLPSQDVRPELSESVGVDRVYHQGRDAVLHTTVVPDEATLAFAAEAARPIGAVVNRRTSAPASKYSDRTGQRS